MIEDREEDLTSSVKRIFAEFGLKVRKQQVRAFYQKRKMPSPALTSANRPKPPRNSSWPARMPTPSKTPSSPPSSTAPWKSLPRTKSPPSLYREVVGLVVRLREQKISMERLRLERARFELDVADLVMKHIDKLKESGALQLEDRTEAAKKIHEELFGKNTKISWKLHNSPRGDI